MCARQMVFIWFGLPNNGQLTVICRVEIKGRRTCAISAIIYWFRDARASIIGLLWSQVSPSSQRPNTMFLNSQPNIYFDSLLVYHWTECIHWFGFLQCLVRSDDTNQHVPACLALLSHSYRTINHGNPSSLTNKHRMSATNETCFLIPWNWMKYFSFPSQH